MKEEEYRKQIFDRLIEFVGDKPEQAKLRGSLEEKREIFLQLMTEIDGLQETNRPVINDETFRQNSNDLVKFFAAWLKSESSNPEVTAILDRPIIDLEIVLTSADSFSHKISAMNMPNSVAIAIVNPGSKVGTCNHCGAELDKEVVVCPKCESQLIVFRQLPLVEGGLLHTSYNFLREILTWPEVISVNNKKMYFPME